MARESGKIKSDSAYVSVEIPPVPEGAGRYGNHVIIGHAENEFWLDFWYVSQVAPNQGSATFLFRAIISLRFIKRVQRALTLSIAKYEQQFGALPEPPKEPDER